MTQKPSSVPTTSLQTGSTTAFSTDAMHRRSYLARGPIVSKQVCLPSVIGQDRSLRSSATIVYRVDKSRAALRIAAMTSFRGPSSPGVRRPIQAKDDICIVSAVC
jgi:hypothetical protein